jgi:hypothetical protein
VAKQLASNFVHLNHRRRRNSVDDMLSTDNSMISANFSVIFVSIGVSSRLISNNCTNDGSVGVSDDWFVCAIHSYDN